MVNIFVSTLKNSERRGVMQSNYGRYKSGWGDFVIKFFIIFFIFFLFQFDTSPVRGIYFSLIAVTVEFFYELIFCRPVPAHRKEAEELRVTLAMHQGRLSYQQAGAICDTIEETWTTWFDVGMWLISLSTPGLVTFGEYYLGLDPLNSLIIFFAVPLLGILFYGVVQPYFVMRHPEVTALVRQLESYGVSSPMSLPLGCIWPIGFIILMLGAVVMALLFYLHQSLPMN